MRAAPAVDYPLAQSGFWRGSSAALGALAAAVPAAWLAGHAWLAWRSFGTVGLGTSTVLSLDPTSPGLSRTDSPLAAALALAVLAGLVLAALVLGGWAGWRRSRIAPARLSWTGAQWELRPSDGSASPAAVAIAGNPELVLDWGDRVLLRWFAADRASPGRPGRCLPLQRRDQPGAWHGLRVALAQANPVAERAPSDASASDAASSQRLPSGVVP